MDTKHASIEGRMLILGYGSIGQGVTPLLLRHLDIAPSQITVVTAEERGQAEARAYGIAFHVEPVTRENYRSLIPRFIGKGDFLVNLSVDVSSVALIQLCREIGALYIDTCIEPWPGGYTDPSLSMEMRTNYALRESALALRTKASAPTAVIAHGANPGLVSHFVKEGMLNIARDTGAFTGVPKTREEWAHLGQTLDIKVIHIAERDTQVTTNPKLPGEFVNTWSIPGFHSEGCQPSEMGWGTHEKELPPKGAYHTFGCGAAIYRMQPGYVSKVRSWTPHAKAQQGWVITHNEAISIADYFTAFEREKVVWRPTVHYAYNPAPDAVLSLHELAGKNGELQSEHRLIVDEIIEGEDELGVLLMGHKKGAYWYGSQLSIEEARRVAPNNNATSLQVTAPVLAGIIWALENPTRGVVDADEMDHARILEITKPYLGNVIGEYSDWTPLDGRRPEDKPPFPENLDLEDPWQFKNFLVS